MKKLYFLIHNISKTLLITITGFSTYAQDGTIFPPQSPIKEISGLKITENLNINGHLEEDAWRLAPIGKDFFKQFPDQGGSPKFDTQINLQNRLRLCRRNANSVGNFTLPKRRKTRLGYPIHQA